MQRKKQIPEKIHRDKKLIHTLNTCNTVECDAHKPIIVLFCWSVKFQKSIVTSEPITLLNYFLFFICSSVKKRIKTKLNCLLQFLTRFYRDFDNKISTRLYQFCEAIKFVHNTMRKQPPPVFVCNDCVTT